MSTVQHTNDYFLPDVAALGETDRAVFDAGFERNGVLVHVSPKQRHAGFDAKRVGNSHIDVDGAECTKRISELLDGCVRRDEFEPRLASI